LYQGVTLGGTGKESGKRHPTLEDNVMVSAGAKVLGSFTVGANSKIGAGSVVLSEVPPNSTVVGVPGRVVKRTEIKRPMDDMDQVHLPDPVRSDLDNLHHEYEKLFEELQHHIDEDGKVKVKKKKDKSKDKIKKKDKKKDKKADKEK
jgi:serine O-acetyltransferase